LQYPKGSLRENPVSDRRYYLVISGVIHEAKECGGRFNLKDFWGYKFDPQGFNIPEPSKSTIDHEDFAFENYWDALAYHKRLTLVWE